MALYATTATRPGAGVNVPAPTRDNPAAGTTGNPAGGMPNKAKVTPPMGVPAGVIGWAVAGLLVVVGARHVFKQGAVA